MQVEPALTQEDISSSSSFMRRLMPFLPMLFSVLREGYNVRLFARDLFAGVTVAIFGLPLSLAIGIGSGARPEAGLYASIIGGFIASALGGARYQIAGPLAAFIATISVIIAHFGYQGFLVATILAGILLVIAGFLRWGTYVRFVPYSMIMGWIVGIVVQVSMGILPEMLGINPAKAAGVFDKFAALYQALPSFDNNTTLISVLSFIMVMVMRKIRPQYPEFLISITLCAILVWFQSLPVETIGSKYNGIPSTLPYPTLPSFDLSWEFLTSFDLISGVLTIAFLSGSVSLICAVVGDRMTQTRHRPNCELVAQGVANIATALFGGLCVASTVARTMTNVRAHAYSPLAGMFHSVVLLLTMMAAAPLAFYLPLASLATILLIVAFEMIEWRRVFEVMRHDRGEAFVLVSTFLLTIFTQNLLIPIAIGTALGAIVFMVRVSESVSLSKETDGHLAEAVRIYRFSGPLFFGSSPYFTSIFEEITSGEMSRIQYFVFDFSKVPLVDETAARTIHGLVEQMRPNAEVYVCNTEPCVKQILYRNGLRDDVVLYLSLKEAYRRMHG